MRIAYISEFAPSDRKASSGTNYKMVESLRNIGEIKWIPIKKTKISFILRLFSKIWNMLFPFKINLSSSKLGSKLIYQNIDVSELQDCDIAVAFFCMPSLSKLKRIDIPLLYFTDTTFPAMINYYPEFSHLAKWNKREGCQMEKQAMENSTVTILSSDWAASSAIRDLSIPEEKIAVIEFGANFDEFEEGSKEHLKDEILNLLFIGVDWIRKGGDLACDTAIWLNNYGIKTKLHIIGQERIPQKYLQYDYIEVHGFLNKNKKEDYLRFISLIKKCDLLLLPTKAECAGIAFAESCAYKLPVITHDTGGIPNYVINGVSGYRLPLGSNEADFGQKIKEIVDSGELEALSESAFELYKNKLNWNRWKEKVEQIIQRMVSVT